MPIYEFRCRVCDVRFDERRTMQLADDAATCPSGHTDVARLLPVFATTGFASATTSVCGSGSGCCGGACGCS
jgi:putative FmdB family regulatory protein